MDGLADSNPDKRRYEIRVLIGPCTQDEAEDAAELVLTAFKNEHGPAVQLDQWQEDEP